MFLINPITVVSRSCAVQEERHLPLKNDADGDGQKENVDTKENSVDY